ncbi:hypothetical protein WN944_015930 [Citrus x changshan-huyou]|uniref:Uncharacterized protein n=1 Tax=Citrus x changshan-huyou TaxID=2935761 RepID=A0AAP0M9Y7_9ROSI
MENGEHHQSVDIDRLADTLRGKFRSLHRLPQKCCIYRVPQQIRGLNPKAHTPQLVSIGPFHHGDSEELRATEEIKIRYLEYFLQRTEVSIETFLADVKNKEEQLRDCYAETIRLENEDFITMVLEDAVFLIEFLLRYSFPNLVSTGDPIFTKSRLISNMWLDIWLLENQLPLFILDDLFNLAKTAVNHDSYNGVSLLSLTHSVFSHPSHGPAGRRIKSELKLRIYLQQRSSQAGVKFQLGSSANLFDITFNAKGILEIPLLRISETTEILFRNLQAFEKLHCGTRYINDYVVIVNYLVNTARDVDLLAQNRVIENWLWNNEAVSTLFHNLVQETSLSAKNFQYTDLVEDMKAYCRYRWHRWKAMLRQDYFNSPWASISVIVAVILLLLTLIQSVCSIIGL